MTDLAIHSAASDFDAERVITLLGLNPRDPKTQAMVAVCQRYAFDPLLKHVVVIPQGGVYVTRDGLLHAAHRSGVFDGMVLESGPDLVDGEWRAVVSVYRKDMSHPFTFPGRYSASGGNRKYAPEMAIKVAECMALRRAFDVSGMGVLEEREAGETPVPNYAAANPAIGRTVDAQAIHAEIVRDDLTRPVERLSTTPDDDAWQTPPIASPATTTAGEVAASPAQAEVVRRSRLNEPDGAPTQAQLKMLGALLRGQSREQALAVVSSIVGRDVESRNDLTKAETSLVLDALKAAEAAS